MNFRWKVAGAFEAAILASAPTNNGEAFVHVLDNGVGFNMKYADKLFGTEQPVK